MSNNPDSDEWDERYEAVREETEKELKEEMHMQTVYFWRDSLDKDWWCMGYKIEKFHCASPIFCDAIGDTLGTELYAYIKDKWERTGKPVGVQMGWLP